MKKLIIGTSLSLVIAASAVFGANVWKTPYEVLFPKNCCT